MDSPGAIGVCSQNAAPAMAGPSATPQALAGRVKTLYCVM